MSCYISVGGGIHAFHAALFQTPGLNWDPVRSPSVPCGRKKSLCDLYTANIQRFSPISNWSDPCLSSHYLSNKAASDFLHWETLTDVHVVNVYSPAYKQVLFFIFGEDVVPVIVNTLSVWIKF